jgi:hypothetical protein
MRDHEILCQQLVIYSANIIRHRNLGIDAGTDPATHVRVVHDVLRARGEAIPDDAAVWQLIADATELYSATAAATFGTMASIATTIKMVQFYSETDFEPSSSDTDSDVEDVSSRERLTIELMAPYTVATVLDLPCNQTDIPLMPHPIFAV